MMEVNKSLIMIPDCILHASGAVKA